MKLNDSVVNSFYIIYIHSGDNLLPVKPREDIHSDLSSYREEFFSETNKADLARKLEKEVKNRAEMERKHDGSNAEAVWNHRQRKPGNTVSTPPNGTVYDDHVILSPPDFVSRAPPPPSFAPPSAPPPPPPPPPPPIVGPPPSRRPPSFHIPPPPTEPPPTPPRKRAVMTNGHVTVMNGHAHSDEDSPESTPSKVKFAL